MHSPTGHKIRLLMRAVSLMSIVCFLSIIALSVLGIAIPQWCSAMLGTKMIAGSLLYQKSYDTKPTKPTGPPFLSHGAGAMVSV